MASNTSEHDRLTETSDEVHNRSERTTQKPPKRQFRSDSPPALRPFRHKPWKTIFLTFFLLFAGLLFVSVGIEQTFEKGIGETYPYFCLGTLLLIPGIYFSVMIAFIWIGVQGFTYEMLPKVDQ